MKLLPFLSLFLCFPFNLAAQVLTKEIAKQHNIKKIFISKHSPNISDNYDIEEYDTSGNLVSISTKYNSMPPFVTDEFKYDTLLHTLTEQRICRSYSLDMVEIIKYFYNGKALQVKKEDTIICPRCRIPKRITEDEYNDSNLLVIERYQDGDLHMLKKYFYDKRGLPEKTINYIGKNLDYIQCYFYDDSKNLIRDSVFNPGHKGSGRNYYLYDTGGKLIEFRNENNEGLQFQTSYTYNDEGLPGKTVDKEKEDYHGKKRREPVKYYTHITYYSYEKY